MNAAFIALPQFEILHVERAETAMKYSGVIKGLSRLSRVEPGWIVTICVRENKFMRGRLSEINLQTFQINIEVSDLASQNDLAIGVNYPLLDGYWGDLAELVLNVALVWQKVKFEPRDSSIHHPDGTTETSQDGWDHEHCRICSQNISMLEADNKYGYVNQNDDWLCESCYQKYVLRKSLDFINPHQVF